MYGYNAEEIDRNDQTKPLKFIMSFIFEWASNNYIYQIRDMMLK